MRYVWLIFIFLTLVCILEVSSSPKRGGGSRGGGSSGSRGSRGSRGSSSGGGSSIKGGRKPKGSKLKKALVTGVGVFTAVQLAKLSLKFPKKNLGYKFDDWNEWREEEGFLCRNNQDCSWVDTRMDCGEYELLFTPNVSHNTIKPKIWEDHR